ncbi:MAG: CFI-box-CTERM domain-containing protein [Nannocystaceae bacterium]
MHRTELGLRLGRGVTTSAIVALGLLAATPSSTAAAAEDDVLVELHFKPVPHAQIAVWIEDADGNFIQDVMVTQATGSLGIGNRPGRWDFLSSWRFPYGPREGVLPVWGHARGQTYPKLTFHDDDPTDQESLGWHENTSSPEPYFCRPLAAAEHETIATDTMTCPSPATFQSDKGKLMAGATSVYPPRNDLVEYEAGHDHADVRTLGELNDLDAITSATPMGDRPELVTTVIPAELVGAGPLVAKIEINLEHDENPDWDFSREGDHFVDPRLQSFGIEYLGQPSVVYAVPFDPANAAFEGTDAYAGYGELDGSSGTLHPPDDSISKDGRSGADRLLLYTLNDETFRFGVYSHGPGTGQTPPDGDGWGACSIADLPDPQAMELEAVDFDTVRVHFTVPPLPTTADVRDVTLYYRVGNTPLTTANAGAAIQQIPSVEQCSGDIVPGQAAWCDVTELFGNYDYQVGLAYEDECGNVSNVVADAVRTPAQEFAQVDGFCFVATAAWGAPWADRVQALRWFRDRYLESNSMGRAFVKFYYYASPPLARSIATHPVLRASARVVLGPVSDIARLATYGG